MAKRYNSNGTPSEELPKAKINKESIKEVLLIFKYLKPYRWKFILGLGFIALSSLSTMAFPFLIKELLDAALGSKERTFDFGINTIAGMLIGLLCIQMVFSF